jgi:hypothetical protein
MINPSSASKSPNPMPAGLGALTQMGPTPKGRSPSNMGQVMAMARKMSDMQLSDVLQGKSLAVPQFAAMTEAMGRKSLRNAMQGAEAQMQAKQPSVKDKLLAEEAAQQLPEASGIGQLPAPNMASMGMAGGGIIAFDDGGEVPSFQNRGLVGAEDLTDEELERLKRPFLNYRTPLKSENKAKDFFNFSNEYAADAKRNRDKEMQMLDPYGAAANVPVNNAAALAAEPPVTLPPGTAPNALPPAGTAPNAAAPRPAGGGGGTPPPAGNTIDQDIAAYTEKYKNMFGQTPEFKKRANPYEGMKYEGDDPSKVKEQGMGYGFMKAAQALLTHPTMAGGMGAAIGAFGEAGLLTAKELKAAKKDERDYNFNMAKANELFEQGQEEKAIKYQTLAQDKEDKIRNLALNTVKAGTDKFSAEQLASYHKMMANKPPEGLALLNALGNPANMAIYQQMNAAKNPKLGTVSHDVALKEYNDRVEGTYGRQFKQQYPNFSTYYNSLSSNQESATPYSDELKRRGLS